MLRGTGYKNLILFFGIFLLPVMVIAAPLSIREQFSGARKEWQKAFSKSLLDGAAEKRLIPIRQYQRAFERQQAAFLRLKDIERRLEPYIQEKNREPFEEAKEKLQSVSNHLASVPERFGVAMKDNMLKDFLLAERQDVIIPLQEIHKMFARIILEMRKNE